MKGIITKGIGGFYYVKAEDGCVYECKARGVFRNEHITPIIGDEAEIEVKNGKGSVTKIFKRRNRLIRPSVSNIDLLVLVVAAAEPDPNEFLIDKMLVNAHINGIDAVVCINKTDISDGEKLKCIYEKAGYKVITVCAEENMGIDVLKECIKGKVSAFAGLSGVGKSSILRIITENDLETGTVSEKIRRGKHTTRHVELFELDGGGFVLDTPGFSSLEVSGITADELGGYFPEIKNCSQACRFRGCSHINEPGCAVKEMTDNGEMAQSRYESYKELFAQLSRVKEWERKQQGI